jgi:hypothetical protein
MLEFDIDKFSMGKLVMTAGVNDRVAEDNKYAKFVYDSIKRHVACDWGDLCKEDKDLNNQALNDKEDPGRLFSAYEFDGKKDRIYVITEWDRSYTTILFPSEY